MTLLERLREKLGKDLMNQVTDALGDDFDWDVVPRSRLNKVIGQRNALQTKLDTLEGKKKPEDDDDDDDSKQNQNPNTKQNSSNNKSNDEGNDIEALKAQHALELANVSKRYAVLDKIRGEKAKDADLVLSQLDLEKVTLKEDGSLEGLDDMLGALKESHSYLFGSDDDGVPSGTGKNSGSGEGDDDVDPFDAVVASYGKS